MVLLGRDGRTLRPGPALFWALTWGAGVGTGVALGGWLTLVGGTGAPGAEGLDPVADLVVLPALALGTVTVVHLCAQVIAGAVRGRSAARRHG